MRDREREGDREGKKEMGEGGRERENKRGRERTKWHVAFLFSENMLIKT